MRLPSQPNSFILDTGNRSNGGNQTTPALCWLRLLVRYILGLSLGFSTTQTNKHLRWCVSDSRNSDPSLRTCPDIKISLTPRYYLGYVGLHNTFGRVWTRSPFIPRLLCLRMDFACVTVCVTAPLASLDSGRISSMFSFFPRRHTRHVPFSGIFGKTGGGLTRTNSPHYALLLVY